MSKDPISYYEIPGSPAVPFDRVCKVDNIFHDTKERRWGFSVHLGDLEKRANFYFSSSELANEGRVDFLREMDRWFKFKFEVID